MAKKLYRLIGIIIIIFILSKINFAEIKEILLNANKYYLIPGLFLVLFNDFIKSIRWNYLKRTQNIKYSIASSFIMYSAAMLAGIVTPGRLGELSKALYLKKDGYSYGKSVFSIVLDRLYDVFFLLIFGTIGMFFFFDLFKKEIPYAIALSVFILIISYLAVKTNIVKKIFSKIFNFLIPTKYQKSWQLNLQDFIDDLRNLKPKHYFIVLGITIFCWLSYYFQMWILAKSIAINIPFLYLAFSVSVAGIVTMIPISYSGIGTRDLILITLFSFFLISKELAVAFSSLILLTYVIIAVFGFFCWLKKPIIENRK